MSPLEKRIRNGFRFNEGRFGFAPVDKKETGAKHGEAQRQPLLQGP